MSDLSSDTDRIYEIYQKRWRIEEYHMQDQQDQSDAFGFLLEIQKIDQNKTEILDFRLLPCYFPS